MTAEILLPAAGAPLSTTAGTFLSAATAAVALPDPGPAAAAAGLHAGPLALGLGAAFLVALLFTGAVSFFSGSETALISINRLKLKLMAAAGFRNATLLQDLLKEQEMLISSMLVGLNLFVIVGSTVVAWILTRTLASGEAGVAATTLLMTPLLLIFGELVPKTIFRQNANRLALKHVRKIHFTYRMLRLVVRHVTFVITLVKNLTGARHRDLALTKDDIQMLIRMSEQDGILNKAEGRMLHSVFEFSKIQARDVMTPRSDVVSVPADLSLEECARVASEHGFSRLPVTDGTIDRIRGFVYIRDLFGRPVAGARVRDVMRPCMFVPETKTIGSLLKEMQAKKAQVAIVVDEYGGTDGICTIEDIVEVIVGDIRDEYDQEEPSLTALAADQYLISGMMDLEEFGERFALPLAEDAESKTVGGFIVERLGRVPATGEAVEISGLRFVVERASKRRVFKVRFFGNGGRAADAAEGGE